MVGGFAIWGMGRALLIGLMALPLSVIAALAEARHALVIGNAAYSGEPLATLHNPLNDTALIAERLGQAGFTVTTATNVDLRGFKTAVRAFADTLSEAGEGGTALFFYAGHGLQGAGRNYLIPLDAVLEREVDLEFEAVSVDWVLATLEASHRGDNVLLLDACRNAGLSRGMGGAGGVGLAPLATSPIGSFISYATAPGMVAYDGNGKHSYYAAAVAEHLLTPGADIEDVFKAVRRSVIAHTHGRQVPWDASSLLDDIVFVEGDGAPAAPLVAANDGPPPQPLPQLALAETGGIVRSHVAKPAGVEGGGEPHPAAAACDAHAAHPDGHGGVTQAGWSDDKIAGGIKACAAAVHAHPDEPRYAFQLARALHANNAVEAARRLYQDAADAGHRGALLHLAEMIAEYGAAAHHDPLPQLLTAASDQAASHGTDASLALALLRLGHCHRGDLCEEADADAALAAYQQAAAFGSADASYQLALLHGDEAHPHYDLDQSVARLAEAVSRGHAPAMGLSGFHHVMGTGGHARDLTRGFDLLDRAAIAGDGKHAARLAKIAYSGEPNFERSHELAFRAAEIAYRAQETDPEILSIIGEVLVSRARDGRNVPRAGEMLEAAYRAGSDNAGLELALLYVDGAVAGKTEADAAAIYRKLAKAGNADAAYGLALLSAADGAYEEAGRWMMAALPNADPATIDALKIGEDASGTALDPATIAAVQTELKAKAFYDGAANGVVDAAFAAAIADAAGQ